ncbi:MAG: hypothetical protein V1930_08150 [Pseudomonadota bacterium]
MKKITLLVLLLFSGLSFPAWAKDFLGAPIMPGGRILTSKKAFMEMTYDLPRQEIIKFYKEAMRDQNDVKFKERVDTFTIEDHGRLPWHKILISKKENGKTALTIIKDSWTWIIGTLFIRFVGVFVVLLILYLAMSVSTGIVSRFVGREAPAQKGAI